MCDKNNTVDYEKRYKEVIESIKRIHNQADSFGKELMEKEFPELRESEDEKIRKAQLNYWRSVGGKEWYGVPVQETIAWLEKQGETFTWSEEDESFRIQCLDLMTNFPSPTGKIDWTGCQNWLKSIKPSIWKPSEEQMKWLKDVIDTVPMTCRQQMPLESLYNDLKKL